MQLSITLLYLATLAVCAAVSNAAGAFMRPTASPLEHGEHRAAKLQDSALGGASFALVVAHHDEDLTWLQDVAQQCKDCHVYVYTSSRARAIRTFSHGTVREVPNVGREWGKYLRFITDEWPALQHSNATVMFMHAHQKGNGADDADRGDVVFELPRWPVIAANHILYLHGSESLIPVGSPNPLDYGALIRTVWPRLFAELGQAPPVKPASKGSPAYLDLYVISGAEFSVPAQQILHHPLSFYRDLEQWLISQVPSITADPKSIANFKAVSFDYAAGSILELLAYRIFQGSAPLSEEVEGNDMFLTPALLRA